MSLWSGPKKYGPSHNFDLQFMKNTLTMSTLPVYSVQSPDYYVRGRVDLLGFGPSSQFTLEKSVVCTDVVTEVVQRVKLLPTDLQLNIMTMAFEASDAWTSYWKHVIYLRDVVGRLNRQAKRGFVTHQGLTTSVPMMLVNRFVRMHKFLFVDFFGRVQEVMGMAKSIQVMLSSTSITAGARTIFRACGAILKNMKELYDWQHFLQEMHVRLIRESQPKDLLVHRVMGISQEEYDVSGVKTWSRTDKICVPEGWLLPVLYKNDANWVKKVQKEHCLGESYHSFTLSYREALNQEDGGVIHVVRHPTIHKTVTFSVEDVEMSDGKVVTAHIKALCVGRVNGNIRTKDKFEVWVCKGSIYPYPVNFFGDTGPYEGVIRSTTRALVYALD